MVLDMHLTLDNRRPHGGLVLGSVLFAAAAAVDLCRRRAAVRQRGAHYTAAEPTQLDDHGLAVVATECCRSTVGAWSI